MEMWKVASGEIGNLPLLDAMIATGRPILLSSGMSDMVEMDKAVDRVRRAGLPLGRAAVHDGVSLPSRTHRAQHDPVLPRALRLLGGPVGSLGHDLSRYRRGDAWRRGGGGARDDEPRDVRSRCARVHHDGGAASSWSTAIRFVERMRASPVDKDAIALDMAPLRAIFTKSLVAREPLPAGTVLTEAHLAGKKPGTGIPAERLPDFVGRVLRRNLEKDEQIRADDIGG